MAEHDKAHGASYRAQRKQIRNRLRRIEGQVRGVEKMVEDDRYCIDVLTQLAAISASLKQVSLIIAQAHARGCITVLCEEGHGDDAIDELVNLLFRFSR